MAETGSQTYINDLPDYIKPYYKYLLNAIGSLAFNPKYIQAMNNDPSGGFGVGGGGNAGGGGGDKDPGSGDSEVMLNSYQRGADINGPAVESYRRGADIGGGIGRSSYGVEPWGVTRSPGGTGGTGQFGGYTGIQTPVTIPNETRPLDPNRRLGRGGESLTSSPGLTQAGFTPPPGGGGLNAWLQSVTAGTVNPDGSAGPRVDFATPGHLNVNYITEDAAQRLAQLYGGKRVAQNMSQDYGPAGAPSAPIQGIQFAGKNFTPYSRSDTDPAMAGQVQFWRERGDTEAQIRQRLGLEAAPPQYRYRGGPVRY